MLTFRSPKKVDLELSAKLQDELRQENESGDSDKLPETVAYFLENGPWEVRCNRKFLHYPSYSGTNSPPIDPR